jgi:hypothetical protein
MIPRVTGGSISKGPTVHSGGAFFRRSQACDGVESFTMAHFELSAHLQGGTKPANGVSIYSMSGGGTEFVNQ